MSASALKPARRWPRYLAGGIALLLLLLIGGVLALPRPFESGPFEPAADPHLNTPANIRV